MIIGRFEEFAPLISTTQRAASAAFFVFGSVAPPNVGATHVATRRAADRARFVAVMTMTLPWILFAMVTPFTDY